MGQTGRNAVTVGMLIDELWRREELGRDRGERKRVSVGTQINESFLRLRDEDGELLPGLPNDITLNHIVTKLPWIDFLSLSSVHRRWLHAIRSHKVHDARVRCHATDKFVVMKFYEEDVLTLYSTTNGFYKLPGIPSLGDEHRSPIAARCVSLNGKIYVLGGEHKHNPGIGWSEVHVLDVAGQRGWRKCASMKDQRHDFGCGTKDGKIYVYGGAHRRKPVRGCEVYDPEQNLWSRIAPMQSWRHGYQVASLGEELFLFTGRSFQDEIRQSDPLVIEAYHPIKNKWRRVGEHPRGTVFMALGKIYVMTANRIEVYDHEKNTWSYLHSIHFGDFGLVEYWFFPRFLRYDIIVAVNDELLVARMDFGDYGLFRGKGLGGKNSEILFRKEHSGHTIEATFSCTIQL